LLSKIKNLTASLWDTLKIGDYLTSSSRPGVAMKATEPGRVIGMALEPLEQCNNETMEQCKIMVFVNPHWSIGQISDDGSLAQAGNGTTNNEQSTILDQFTLAIKNSLKKLGLILENGIANVKELFAEKVRTERLEMVDQSTGEIYCTWIENGEWLKVKGECQTAEPPAEEEPPTKDACNVTHLNLCTTQELCEGASLYWYKETCNTEPETPACTPNWHCTDWQPLPENTVCGQTFTQTRTCTDKNNCDIEEGKPAEEQQVSGNLCTASNATGVCQEENCTFTCEDGFSDCDNDITNGCETQGDCLPAEQPPAGESSAVPEPTPTETPTE